MQHHAEAVQMLRRIALFAELDEAQLAKILETTQRRELTAGEFLFMQGEGAEQFFWLESGLLKLYRVSPIGEEKIIEIVRAGQTFAEAIMFMGQRSRYPVNAQMIEGGVIWCFANASFHEVLRGSVDTCFRLLAGMSRRLHQHVNEIERLTLQTATERVINYLMQQAEPSVNPANVHLPITKQTLAAQLSITPETLSRTFTRLAKAGLIEIRGNDIALLDVEGLRRKAML
ncbi:MAG: Crp/Fnr family transcriptional regulator [Pseudomonadota bacterium]